MQWVLGSLLFCLAWPDGERYMSRACFAHMFCVQVTMETRVDDGYVAVEYAHPKTKKTNTELSKERVEYAHPKTKKTNTEVTQMVIK